MNYEWKYSASGAFCVPCWTLCDQGGAVAWIDAKSGGWSIYDGDGGADAAVWEPEVYATIEEAKAIAFMRARMGEG